MLYMDDSNQHLKHLLKQTDIAFKALMREPASRLLNEQYEKAKLELDSYSANFELALSLFFASLAAPSYQIFP